MFKKAIVLVLAAAALMFTGCSDTSKQKAEDKMETIYCQRQRAAK
jgi:outer membrane biogenesis lipoprotein LolB